MNRHLSATHRTAKLSALFAALGGVTLLGASTPALSQDAMPAPAGEAPVELVPVDPQKQRAASLIDEAITVAQRNPEARPALARGAAALLPRLEGRTRQGLTNRWVALVSTSAVPRDVRLSAFSSFFDVATRGANEADLEYGRDVALMLPDPTARAGAFIRLSSAAQATSWDDAAHYAALAQRAARQESDLAYRARTLAYIATHIASLNPATREDAVVEASSQARLIQNPDLRHALLAEVVGAAAKFDITLAQRIAADIPDLEYQNLATARIAVAQAQSSFAVRQPDTDRVAQIVAGVPRHDTSFIPVLLQLPPTPEVFEALGNALPPVYPGAPIAIEASTLERIWNFASDAPPSVYRDQLQSRVARLMVLHDLWRGREWGQQLAWEGGRRQIANFVDATVRSRESALQSEQLRARTIANLNNAILASRNLGPTERVEALLLIAGQLLSRTTTTAV